MKELLFNAKSVLSRSRYPWVDYARGICILLVCYRHVFEGLATVGEGSVSYPLLKYSNIFFFSFRMPLFFIVSGFFFAAVSSRNTVKDFISKRFQTIFYPLLVWGAIHISMQLAFANYVNAKRVPFDYINLIINPRQIEQFWYLNALFFVGVFYVLIKHYFKVKAWQQLFLGAMLYLYSGYLHRQEINVGFISDVMFFYPFFAIGDILSSFVFNPKNYKFLSSPLTFILLTPVFILVQYYFTGINLELKDDYYVQYNVPLLYAIAALTGGAFIINFSFMLERLDVLRFLRVIGYHSLYIYVMHLMITSFTRIFFVRVLGYTEVPLIMIAAVTLGIVIPIAVFNLANRFGAYWLFTLRKPVATGERQTPHLKMQVGLVSPKESEGSVN